MLNIDELRQLSNPSATKTWLAILLDWTGIALLLTLVILYPNPLTYLITFILIARQQLALAILMHDGAHGRLFKSPFWNNYLGQILTASPLFFSMGLYRTLHLKHHKDPLTPEDPDLNLTGGYPISKKSLIRKLARDLFGLSYFKFIQYFISKSFQKKKLKVNKEGAVSDAIRGPKISFITILFWNYVMNGLIFLCLWLAGHPWYYLFFWLIPMMTALQVLLRIRGITEHAGYQPNKDQRLNTRTVINPLQTFFFAPHGVNYHIEHHVYPSVPFHNLPQTHALMKERNSLPSENIFYSYRDVLKDLTI